MKPCPLCKRKIPEGNESTHHLIPKSRGGRHHKRNLIRLHRECHVKIHSILSVDELARNYNTIDKLLEYDGIERYVKWVKNRPIE